MVKRWWPSPYEAKAVAFGGAAEDELPEEFAVVYGRAERVFALREAERDEWLQKYQIKRASPERSDTARDHALITELMRKLDDTC
ncbi:MULTISPECIES: hypothetical protein [unclassified Streptomyces]|uniref:hypothetical protein n=1 Tax=unclassified Streptomyces TaxID=2593676 RepID=UPI0036EF2F3D